MLRKALNSSLHIARSTPFHKSLRFPALYDQSTANFSDSNNPPQDPKSPFLSSSSNEPQKQKEGSKKGSFGQGKKDDHKAEGRPDRHGKGPQGGEPKRMFQPKGAFQKKEPVKKEEHQADEAWHEENTDAVEGRESRSEEGFGKGFSKGGDRPKTFKGLRGREEDGAKPKIAFQKRDKERVPKEGEAVDEEHPEPLEGEEGREFVDDKLRSLARGDKRFGGKGAKPARSMFGSKEVQSGYILSKMQVEIEAEVDTTSQEITPEQKEAVMTRIASVKQLENTPKKYQNLMELYLLVNLPQEAQQVYTENQEVKLKKDMVIENLMFEACLKDSYEKAKQFYAYLKNEGKLEEVFAIHMAKYIELQTSNARYEEVSQTLDDLRSTNYNLGGLEVHSFNNFFGFNTRLNEKEFVEKLRSKQEFEFIRKSEIFVEYLREILRKKPAQLESFPHQFRFPYFFKVLNSISYPKIKLDSNGLDVCMNYLELLAGSNLLSSKTIDFADLAKYTALYFEVPEAFNRVYYILSSIPEADEFFPHFLKELNNFIAEKGVAPFDAQVVQDQYLVLKDQIAKSKRYLGTEALRVILELAQAHRQYDLIFDIYENYGSLVQKKESPLFLYIYLMNTFTHLKLSTKNCIQIVRKLKDEYEQKYGGFPATLDAFVQTKALIKDGAYQDAHIIFEKKILNQIIPNHQRTLIFTYLAMMFVMEDNTENRSNQEIEEDDMFLLKEFVNDLSEEELREIFKKLEDDNQIVYDIGGAEDIDEHLRYWENVAQNPEQRDQEMKEYRLKVQEEYLKLVEKKREEIRLLNNPFAEPIELPEVDPEIEEDLNPLESNWEYDEMNLEDLDTEELIELLSRAFSDREEIKRLIKLPLQKNKIEKNNFTLSRAREEYNKSILDLVNDLMIWGVSVNEPLAIQLGEQFYDLVGHKMSPYMATQLRQYYKYQLSGEISRKENSFDYVRDYVKRAPKRFENANEKYTILEDDETLNSYLDGLNQDPQTRHLFERNVRHQPLLKRDLFAQDELNGRPTEGTAKDLLKSTKPNFMS